MPSFDQPTAAYLYLLSIDSPGLAWEYLRRNEGYQADWTREGASSPATAWGLRFRGGSRPRRPRCRSRLAA